MWSVVVSEFVVANGSGVIVVDFNSGLIDTDVVSTSVLSVKDEVIVDSCCGSEVAFVVSADMVIVDVVCVEVDRVEVVSSWNSGVVFFIGVFEEVCVSAETCGVVAC